MAFWIQWKQFRAVSSPFTSGILCFGRDTFLICDCWMFGKKRKQLLLDFGAGLTHPDAPSVSWLVCLYLPDVVLSKKQESKLSKDSQYGLSIHSNWGTFLKNQNPLWTPKLAVWLNFLEKKSSGLFSVTRGGNFILFVIKRRSHLQKLSFHGRKNWGEVAQYCTQRLIDRQNLRSDCLAALQPGCHRNKC